MSLLACENVALQAKLEEQTESTEQLEFELTKLRRQHSQESLTAEQRESQDAERIKELKGK